jgi:replicative superfamily II helicase
VSHLRDVGLIGASYYDNDAHLNTGRKIVYIAPMKALVSPVSTVRSELLDLV